MYGNQRLPGFEVGNEYRDSGSMWLGYPADSWFKTVMVKGAGEDGVDIPVGSVMTEQADGTYAVTKVSDIANSVDKIPGSRLVIVADKTAKTGTKKVANGVTTDEPASILVGTHGRVDKTKLLVSDTPFMELSDTQQKWLNMQLEAWGFQLEYVQQS